MKLSLKFTQTPMGDYNETRLTHIKLMDDDGKYIKFLKHDPELIAYLESVTIPMQEPQPKLFNTDK